MYINEKQKTIKELDINTLSRWILSHPNEVNSVKDCMSVKPPKDFQIIKILSRAGSQKLVFLSQWIVAQKQVVLKALKEGSESSELVIEREYQTHPLNLTHNNIIETNIFQNEDGVPFLVEEKLGKVLDDRMERFRLLEAANLLHDMAKALTYLHDRLGKVHGDIKPDNIGVKNDSYILLDFGICRTADKFNLQDHPSGSIRTRAPELLVKGKYEDAYKVDIWALGATLYHAIIGRFPFFKEDEIVPRLSHPVERQEKEKLLKERAQNWQDWIIFPEQTALTDILKKMLDIDPHKRITAKDVLELTSKQLAAFIRNNDDNNKISPLDELAQLKHFLPNDEALKLMPSVQREKFKSHLETLQAVPLLPDDEHKYLSQLLKKVI